MAEMYEAELKAELERRARRGQHPTTIKEISRRLAELGYRLDRTKDCRHIAQVMTGPDAGTTYPAVSTDICEMDSGRSFANVAARRDERFEALQALRSSQELFAVTRGAILDL